MKNTVLKPSHDQVGALVPKTDAVDLQEQAKEQRQQAKLPEDLHKYLKSMWDKWEKHDHSSWLRHYRRMIKMRKYFDGDQKGFVNEALEWREYDIRPNEVFHIKNIVQPHVQTALMEMSRGRTDLVFSSVAPNSRRGKMISDVATARYRAHKKKLFSARLRQHEDTSLLLNGVAARYTYWDSESRPERVPIISDQEMDGESMEVCSVCQSRKRGEVCDKCGSEQFQELGTKGRAKVVSGYEEVTKGNSRWVSVDPLGLNFFLSAVSVEDTPYIIWRQPVPTDKLRTYYPDVAIKDGITSTALRYKMEQDGSAAAMEFMSESDDEDITEFAQGWFDVELYANKVLEEDAVLRNGRVLPAGTKLGDAFPNGLYLARNHDQFLDMWSEDKNRKWTIAPYVGRLGTMVGAGMSVILSEQDILNDLRNMQVVSTFHDAYRREFYNADIMDPDNLPNDPTEAAFLENFPVEAGRMRGIAFDTMEPSTLSPEAYQLEQNIEQNVQGQAGTFSAAGAGMPDIKAVQNTATGFQMYREMTVGRFSPMLEMKAEALDREQAYQLLELDQEHLSMEDWELYKGDYGADAVKAFLSADLREELMIEVAYESYMPQSTSQKLAKTAEYIPFMATLMQMGITPDTEYGSYIAGLFGQPQEHVQFNVEYDRAMAIVSKLQDVADNIVDSIGDIPTSNILDPVALQMGQLVFETAGIEINPELDHHAAMLEAYSDWWIKDEGRSASNVLKAAIGYTVREHKGAMVLASQDKGAMTLASTAPEQQAAAEAEEAARAQEGDAETLRTLATMAEADTQREHEAALQEQELAAEQERTEPPVVQGI